MGAWSPNPLSYTVLQCIKSFALVGLADRGGPCSFAGAIIRTKTIMPPQRRWSYSGTSLSCSTHRRQHSGLLRQSDVRHRSVPSWSWLWWWFTDWNGWINTAQAGFPFVTQRGELLRPWDILSIKDPSDAISDRKEAAWTRMMDPLPSDTRRSSPEARLTRRAEFLGK